MNRYAAPYPARPFTHLGSAQGSALTWGMNGMRPQPDANFSQDHFLDGKYSLSSQQVAGFLMAGFALAFGGRSIAQLLNISKTKASSAARFDPSILERGTTDTSRLTVYQNYNDALSSIYRIIQLDPKQGNALLAYAATCVLGYLSGGVVQGAKETWVRHQETTIRAHLIHRLQSIVRQSIHQKYEFDTAFKNEVRLKIANLLTLHQIPNLNDYLEEVPTLEPLDMNRRYFYEPTHRTLPLGSALPHPVSFQGYSLSAPEAEAQNETRLLALQKALVFALGAVGGFVVQGFIKLMIGAHQNKDKTVGEKSVMESIQLKDTETWALIGSKSRKNFAIMCGFFAMSAAASVGKLLLDGLREIEVTRLNARTEYGYQSHNWLSQDPMFHQIAEEEAVNNELRQLQIDMVCLKMNPTLLRQRIQSILLNIGRNSAPPYYPMTPTVGLVEARA